MCDSSPFDIFIETRRERGKRKRERGEDYKKRVEAMFTGPPPQNYEANVVHQHIQGDEVEEEVF